MHSPRLLFAVNPFAVFALMLFIAAGCNAFEFMYEEGNSDDPDVILDDARIALQNGDTEKAIELLEKALDKAPDNREIKIELSSALFQHGDIDLLVMKDLAEYISDDQASSSNKSLASVCTFSAPLSTTRVLEFNAEEAYLKLLDHTDLLARAIELLSEDFHIDNAEELAENLVSNAYLMRAIAMLGSSVLDIQAKADELGATLHQRTNGSIGYCAPTPAAASELESFVLCEQLPIWNAALDDLLERQQMLGLANSELVDAVAGARDELTNTASLSCSPFYPAR